MKKVHNSIRTKRIVCLMLSVILLVCLLSACGGDNKTDEDATANVESELSNDVISIDGIYIDNSFDDANQKLVYLFYTLTAKDANLSANRYLIDLFINDTNTYRAVTSKDYTPYYTEYYYSDFNEDVFVGTSLKVCQTYLVPNGDLVDDKIVKFQSTDIDVQDIHFSVAEIKTVNGIEEIAKELNAEVFAKKYEDRQNMLAEVDEAIEAIVRNGLNGFYWQFYANPSSYKIEFSEPNNFTISAGGLSNQGTYSVRNQCIVLTYPSNDAEIIVEYTCNSDGTPALDGNGSIMLPTIADAFVAGADYDGRE